MTVVSTDTPPCDSPYEATLQHLTLIRRKQERLAQTADDAQRQVLHRAACDYDSGALTQDGLFRFFLEFREASGDGYSRLWNETMPLNVSRIQGCIRHYGIADPAGDGLWQGEFPFGTQTRTPMNGLNVVYVLFDAKNVPCYVGSTAHFRTRLKKHRSGAKAFVRWTAHLCADREAAYVLEEKLLGEHQPYLNRRCGR